MAQSKIKTVTPQVFNGVQQVWQNKFTGKPNYGFNIAFEDGISGNCASEKSVYPFQQGTEVTYEIAPTTHRISQQYELLQKVHFYKYHNISKLKNVAPMLHLK